MRNATLQPDVMPILSAGRHRSPRRGACFMEFASYLAGERWSDHPKCTNGSLAHLARLVNDLTNDAARARLTPLIPSVIGLTSDDPMLDVRLAVRAASTALPNSERMLSPGESTTRPPRAATIAPKASRYSESVRTVASSSSPMRRL